MRRTLSSLNLALATIFALALAVLTFAPGSVERQAHRELVRRISSAAMERYPALGTPRWTDAINAAMRGDAAELRARMTSPELEVVAAGFATLCRHDCPDRTTVASLLREAMTERLRVFDRATQRVEDWARGHYHDLVGELVNDLRILDTLPVTARRLASELNLHDALTRAVVLDRATGKLVLSLRCGDLASGYFDIDLEYRNVEIAPDCVSTLRELADQPDAEVLYDEVDLSEGPVVLHRLLFAPHGEIELCFRELAIRVARRSEREVEREGFVELEVDE